MRFQDFCLESSLDFLIPPCLPDDPIDRFMEMLSNQNLHVSFPSSIEKVS